MSWFDNKKDIIRSGHHMLKLLKKKFFFSQKKKKKKKNLILRLKVQCIIQNPFIFFKVSPPSSIQLFYINILYIYIYMHFSLT